MGTANLTPKSSRLGTKGYKSPPPLRFDNVKGAKEFIRANRLKVHAHVSHTRGHRIQVVYPNGKPRTISIEIRKESK